MYDKIASLDKEKIVLNEMKLNVAINDQKLTIKKEQKKKRI